MLKNSDNTEMSKVESKSHKGPNIQKCLLLTV